MDEGEHEPPVDEVVVSVAFANKQSLTGPWLGITVGSWLSRFPNVERQPPYDMPVEHPPGMHIPTGGGLRFEMLQGGVPNVRFWLSSNDESQLVQVQPDYFGVNWRRKGSDPRYPGYLAMRSLFFELLDELNNSTLQAEDGPLEIRAVELTYVDIIQSDDLWQRYSDAHKIVNIDFGGMADYEQFGLSYTRVLFDLENNFRGRMHVNVQPGVKVDTGAPVLNLTTTVRSAPLLGNNFVDVGNFLDAAHDKVTENFNSITTSDARKAWGLS